MERHVRSKLDSLPHDVFEEHEHDVLKALRNQISEHALEMQKSFESQEKAFDEQFKAAYNKESLCISNELQPVINNGKYPWITI